MPLHFRVHDSNTGEVDAVKHEFQQLEQLDSLDEIPYFEKLRPGMQAQMIALVLREVRTLPRNYRLLAMTITLALDKRGALDSLDTVSAPSTNRT